MTTQESPARLQGVGIGLRAPHTRQVLQQDPAIDWQSVQWLELLADNHLAPGGAIKAQLERLCELYPISLHCVGMNLGGLDPVNIAYLQQIRELAARSGAVSISDHLCFTTTQATDHHDLLPMPYTEEALAHMVTRIAKIQELLGQRLLIENPSAYLSYAHNSLSEAEFLSELATQADCLLLLDVNNLYVNQINLGFDAADAIDQLPQERIAQIHLGGHQRQGEILIDAHSRAVSEPVWALYEQAQARVPHCPTLIEWDNDIPPLEQLIEQAQRAEAIIQRQRSCAA